MIGDGLGLFLLVLIDGIEGDLNIVNFNDIEFVLVLKDVVFVFIYGVRVLFGVIFVIMKSGKSGKINVLYSGSVCFLDVIGVLDIMDFYIFVQYFNCVFVNKGGGDIFVFVVMECIKVY